MQATCKRVKHGLLTKIFNPASSIKVGNTNGVSLLDSGSEWLNKEKLAKKIETEFGRGFAGSLSIDVNGQTVNFARFPALADNEKFRNNKFRRFLKNHYESVDFKP
jgi:hypothetical protein